MRAAIITTLASLAAVHAHPASHSSRALNRRAVDLDAFRMVIQTDYKNATQVDADPTIPTLRARATTEETATELVQSQAPGAKFRLVDDHYVGDNGVAHFYFKQTANGLDIDNADFNVNVSILEAEDILWYSVCRNCLTVIDWSGWKGVLFR
jgi:extracellular elastinolytic metalloproteinase